MTQRHPGRNRRAALVIAAGALLHGLVIGAAAQRSAATSVPGLTSSDSTAPDSTQPAADVDVSGFPDASNTGVPDGTDLRRYRGPCTITVDNTVIDRRIVDCPLSIQASGVVLKRSQINGPVTVREGTGFSLQLEDSEVDAGVIQLAAVSSANLTILRSEIVGGQTSVYCHDSCVIRDSWLHGQRLPEGSDWHLGAFLANDVGEDGRTDAVLVHNTIHCEAAPTDFGGGCSGDINLFGDFGAISYVTVDNNFLRANFGISFCVYGGQAQSKPYPDADHVVVTNNVFERGVNDLCGEFGPVTNFDVHRPGNRWENNVWMTGEVVPPEN